MKLLGYIGICVHRALADAGRMFQVAFWQQWSFTAIHFLLTPDTVNLLNSTHSSECCGSISTSS